MKYFSSSSLQNESELFKSFTCKGDFCVVGFSSEASKALDYVYTCCERIDKLQLISPIFSEYNSEKLDKIKKRGIEIEVYLGGDDKIIDSLHVKEFFQEFATIYYIKNKGHRL